MILPQLLWRFARHRDDPGFYQLQADDAIRWLRRAGVPLGPGCRVLDLGCGHGVFGGRLRGLGCEVTFADESNHLLPELRSAPFRPVNLDQDHLAGFGEFDLVICSNVLEHLRHPEQFLARAHQLLRPAGLLYLSWTNWLSPWGGHEFSPWHYLGPARGPRVYDALGGRRFHRPGVNLFVTSIGGILQTLRTATSLELVRSAPRYYTELSFLMRIPGVREFLAWNAALLLRRRAPGTLSAR